MIGISARVLIASYWDKSKVKMDLKKLKKPTITRYILDFGSPSRIYHLADETVAVIIIFPSQHKRCTRVLIATYWDKSKVKMDLKKLKKPKKLLTGL